MKGDEGKVPSNLKDEKIIINIVKIPVLINWSGLIIRAKIAKKGINFSKRVNLRPIKNNKIDKVHERFPNIRESGTMTKGKNILFRKFNLNFIFFVKIPLTIIAISDKIKK